MFQKTAIVAALGLAASAAAQAQETPVATGDQYVDSFRWQLNGTAGMTNIDVGRDDGDVDVFGLSGRFYFKDVVTNKGPLGEAAFVDMASSIGAGWVYTDADDIVEDLDADAYTIDGRFVFNRFIVEGAWTRETPDFSDIDFFSVGLGYYITDTTTLVGTYRTSDVDESNNIDAGDIDEWNIGLEHLWLLGNDGAGIKLEGNYGWIDVDNADDIDSYNLAGTWYITRGLGIGANYSRFDNFGLEADTYGLDVEWFLTDDIALSAAYTYEEVDDTDVEIESFEVGAEIRF